MTTTPAYCTDQQRARIHPSLLDNLDNGISITDDTPGDELRQRFPLAMAVWRDILALEPQGESEAAS